LTTGRGLTVILTVLVATQLLASVTVTVYVPDIDVVEFNITGLCTRLVKLFGPVQLYEVPPEEVRLMVFPAQTGEVPRMVATGRGLTVTFTDEVAEQLLASVTVTK
jgi:hypothetical protein